MQQASMNKLRSPDCGHCAGAGCIRLTNDHRIRGVAVAQHPTGEPCGPGWFWAACVACNGTGRR